MTDQHNRAEARDATIRALLPLVPAQGWTLAGVRLAAGDAADLLFPGGPAELVEAYIDLADGDMAAVAPTLVNQKLSKKVRSLILARFAQAEPHKEAVRRAFCLLALPANLAIAARCTARTVDAIWAAAGDTSADFSWYTKRALLGSIYTSTLLYWLKDGRGTEDVEAFLDRRLAGVAQIGKLRARLTAPRDRLGGAPATR